ncbi:MAG: hypothetical protein DIU76_11045 [Bacillota bacterium]|nr:MAG: hypothetical protein DIU76_11045 [Bacillota bacterium]
MGRRSGGDRFAKSFAALPPPLVLRTAGGRGPGCAGARRPELGHLDGGPRLAGAQRAVDGPFRPGWDGTRSPAAGRRHHGDGDRPRLGGGHHPVAALAARGRHAAAARAHDHGRCRLAGGGGGLGGNGRRDLAPGPPGGGRAGGDSLASVGRAGAAGATGPVAGRAEPGGDVAGTGEPMGDHGGQRLLACRPGLQRHAGRPAERPVPACGTAGAGLRGQPPMAGRGCRGGGGPYLAGLPQRGALAAVTREAQPTDGELWRQLQEGSQSSLEALVRRYHGPLWAYAWRCTRDYHAAQDLVQETFVTLLEKGHTVQQPGALKQWLFRVLTRRILDWQKAACRREVAGGDTGIPSAESEAPRGRVISLAEVLEGKEQRQRVWVALQELPPAQRAVIVLRFYHDLSLPEIADILGTPVGTVKSRSL